ncbi:hypothetical protein YERSI8AC_560015 [Enterobacterales bacterium 8AC]|nr:hypothetical protein YERSI8AC_560015 [Enterobacterales bacterium 8AC]
MIRNLQQNPTGLAILTADDINTACEPNNYLGGNHTLLNETVEQYRTVTVRI